MSKVKIYLQVEGQPESKKTAVLVEPKRSAAEILTAMENNNLFSGAIALVGAEGVVLKDALHVKEGEVIKVRLAPKNLHLPPKKGTELRSGQSAKMIDGVPEFTPHRLKIWEELRAKRAEENKAKSQPIKITFVPDGSVSDGMSFVTKPFDILAAKADKEKKNSAIVAVVNGKQWDLSRPIESDCTIDFIFWGSKEGKEVFWHSSSHILGQVMERLFGAHLCKGPAIETGFYYDVDMDRPVKEEDFANIEKLAAAVVKDNQPFERLEMSKEEALEMFRHNQFKQTIISEKVPDGAICTAYRCGPLIDLCRGPHLPTTARVKAFKVTKNSSAYWDGHAENATLQRVYGVSFPTKEECAEYEFMVKEAAKRDHRKLGQDQDLFFFHPLAPGSCFFMPHGAKIYNKLMNLMRAEYIRRGFQEVITPNVFNVDLWKTSGHWQNYQENMFSFGIENQTFALKPMNCPGHCLVFEHNSRSYKELPVRMADFGVLHRNEFSGALTGLTRVRRFQQDDAHIFCRPDQVMEEITSCLDFLQHIYGIFGFTFELDLSTRPQKYMGEIADWDKAEASLKQALDNFAKPWNINPGDGAFYGPKIDIKIYDALKRRHQCATIQLDFQLPQKFNLSFIDDHDQKVRPVIIHRAILGSVERFIAVLTEHVAGKWPFWLSPRQIAIIPVAITDDAIMKFSREIATLCMDGGGYSVFLDDSGNTLPKKVREAQVQQYNFMFVIGNEELAQNSVNVRTRENQQEGLKSKDALLPWLKSLESSYK